MALLKKFLKSKPVCKVTFTHDAENIEDLVLVGDFNNWDAAATPFKKLKSGVFKVVVDLEVEKQYEYKFLSKGTYFNDNNADALVFNAYANSENSLVRL